MSTVYLGGVEKLSISLAIKIHSNLSDCESYLFSYLLYFRSRLEISMRTNQSKRELSFGPKKHTCNDGDRKRFERITELCRQQRDKIIVECILSSEDSENAPAAMVIDRMRSGNLVTV